MHSVDEQAWLAERFEEQRPHLRSVAYRMLGWLTEADDAVQDAWLRLSGAGMARLENPDGWLDDREARGCLVYRYAAVTAVSVLRGTAAGGGYAFRRCGCVFVYMLLCRGILADFGLRPTSAHLGTVLNPCWRRA